MAENKCCFQNNDENLKSVNILHICRDPFSVKVHLEASKPK